MPVHPSAPRCTAPSTLRVQAPTRAQRGPASLPGLLHDPTPQPLAGVSPVVPARLQRTGASPAPVHPPAWPVTPADVTPILAGVTAGAHKPPAWPVTPADLTPTLAGVTAGAHKPPAWPVTPTGLTPTLAGVTAGAHKPQAWPVTPADLTPTLVGVPAGAHKPSAHSLFVALPQRVFQHGLPRPELRIAPSGRQQRGVAAGLHRATALEHHDLPCNAAQVSALS